MDQNNQKKKMDQNEKKKMLQNPKSGSKFQKQIKFIIIGQNQKMNQFPKNAMDQPSKMD